MAVLKTTITNTASHPVTLPARLFGITTLDASGGANDSVTVTGSLIARIASAYPGIAAQRIYDKLTSSSDLTIAEAFV